MSDLATTAQKLRTVKDACVDFMILWAVDCMMTEILCGERIWGDVMADSSDSGQNNVPFSKFGRRMDD